MKSCIDISFPAKISCIYLFSTVSMTWEMQAVPVSSLLSVSLSYFYTLAKMIF